MEGVHAEDRRVMRCPSAAGCALRREMTGATDTAGNPRPLRKGLLNFVMVRNEEKWQIAVMHNFALTELPQAQK